MSDAGARAFPGWIAPVYVRGVAALSGFGVGWRGLAAYVRRGERARAREVPALDDDDEPCEPRQRKLMSRAAYLSAAAIKMALRELSAPSAAAAATSGGIAHGDADADADGEDRGEGAIGGEVGLYMGVGASGGDMRELESMLRASVEDGVFGLDRFGGAGLSAANPLFAFQLMNNFTLCHGAILAGLHGPNGAFFSRGAGTVTALREAAFAVASGDAPAALAGGADSALHPVTTAELGRAGWIARGLVPAEGAALLALAAQAPPSGAPCARLTRAEVHVARDRALTDVATAALDARPGEIDDGGGAAARERSPRAIVICACQPATHAVLAAAAAASAGARGAEILDAAAVLGESLAAAPALGWAIACDWLREHEGAREHARAIVLSAGIDGDLGVAELVAGAAP